MFSCLPIGNAHEWCMLREFVGQYAKLSGKSYHVVHFPEVVNRNTKEPEVLLEAREDGGRVVIERKSIVPPMDGRFMANHRNGHDLFDCFLQQMDSYGLDYSDTLYRLSVRQRDLNNKRKQEIPKIAEQIASGVLLDWESVALTDWDVGGETPIWWEFRTMMPGERDFDDPDTGIVYTVNVGSTLSKSPDMIEQERLGYVKEFEHQAARAAEKFVQYADCRKLLLVQFFGEMVSGVGDEEIIEIIRAAHLPKEIDEVWVAREQWVDLDESEIVWQWVR